MSGPSWCRDRYGRAARLVGVNSTLAWIVAIAFPTAVSLTWPEAPKWLLIALWGSVVVAVMVRLLTTAPVRRYASTHVLQPERTKHQRRPTQSKVPERQDDPPRPQQLPSTAPRSRPKTTNSRCDALVEQLRIGLELQQGLSPLAASFHGIRRTTPEEIEEWESRVEPLLKDFPRQLVRFRYADRGRRRHLVVGVGNFLGPDSTKLADKIAALEEAIKHCR